MNTFMVCFDFVLFDVCWLFYRLFLCRMVCLFFSWCFFCLFCVFYDIYVLPMMCSWLDFLWIDFAVFMKYVFCDFVLFAWETFWTFCFVIFASKTVAFLFCIWVVMMYDSVFIVCFFIMMFFWTIFACFVRNCIVPFVWFLFCITGCFCILFLVFVDCYFCFILVVFLWEWIFYLDFVLLFAFLLDRRSWSFIFTAWVWYFLFSFSLIGSLLLVFSHSVFGWFLFPRCWFWQRGIFGWYDGTCRSVFPASRTLINRQFWLIRTIT